MFTPVRLARPDDVEWDAFVAGHPVGHFLQSAGWGRLRAGLGWRVVRVGVRDAAGRLVAGAQAQVRRSPLGPVAYLPRGPVCTPGDPAWPALAAALRAALGRWAVAARCEPPWVDEPGARRWLAAQGWREAPAVQPPSTVLVDLANGEAALWAGLKQKWRYNVRVAQRQGVSVRAGDAADLPMFARLMAETAARDGFHARPSDYYGAVWQALSPHARLHVAEWSGQPLAAIFVVHHGPTATYLYGASSGQERQRMPNHLVQWEAMCAARAAGLVRYDFWGIPDAIGRAALAGVAPEAVPRGTGDLWGVWGFKRGFGGTVWRAVGAWDWVLAPRRYALGARLRRLLDRGPGGPG